MSKFHIATSSLNLTPLDWDGNSQIITEVLSTAKKSGVDILCFPELCISGYGCEDMFFADWVLEKAKETLISIAEFTENITCILGCPLSYHGARYNCAVVVSNKKIIGIVPKQFLANSGVYYESRWFKPWRGEQGLQEKIEVFGNQIPFGKLLFDIGDMRFGVEVCEDAWVKDRPLREFASQGVSLVLNLSASHFSFGKTKDRLALSVKGGELIEDLVYVYSNHQGNEAGRLIYDGGSFIAEGSNVLAVTERFSFKSYELVSAVVDLKAIDRRPDNVSTTEQNLYQVCKIENLKKTIAPAPIQGGKILDKSKEEEFTLAVSLALFDYLRKSGHQAFVISLSGGADSSACAILSYLALTLASKERGGEYVRNVLGQDSLNSIDFNKALICAYLGTENSSKKTFEASKALAEEIGANFLSYQIDDLVSSYTEKIENTYQKLSWQENDIPLQNIQARSRGPLVWFLANLSNGLLLSTSNRSEAAVGYTTMDGDTCGGISPIGGINKTFLLKWLRWLSNAESHCFGNFSALQFVLSNKPTAELRPREFTQTDEADLMPYEILDFIEKRFLLDRFSEELIIKSIISEFKLEPESAKLMVAKFLRLWTRNQWKRERYAPSFHLDEENLDPKTWCRYPILSAPLS